MNALTPASRKAPLWIGLLLWMLQLPPAGAGEPSPQAGEEFFERKVRPLLVEHCLKCHTPGAKRPKGGLALDSRAGLLKGGDSGPVLVPGEPGKSRLVEAIGYGNVDLRMPPRAKLPDAAIADLTAWVKMGAPWPRDTSTTVVDHKEFDLARRKREHWAWQPVRSGPLPEVKDPNWCRHPVDRFILAGLEARGLRPAGDSDRRALLRRVYFDLIGLPPKPEEVEVFVNDGSADALARVVDRLLGSEQFGERWARHWLDVVRYAESRGHEFDYTLPNAYQYRDYVIRALNADLPYDRFVTEHIAGDLLAKPRLHPTEGFNESILGTGFWLLGEEVHSPVDIRQDQADRFDNRIDVMAKAFLGLTVSCARCHDHKFDAISTRDYYALFGFLASSNVRLARFDALAHNRPVAEELWRLRDQARGPLLRALADGLRPAVGQTAAYLLAARQAIQAGPESPGKIEELARARKLDAGRLAGWVACLRTAGRADGDPLHAWARLATDGAAEPKRIAEVIKPLVERWRQQEAAAEAALAGAQVIVDYGKPGPGDFLPDEFAFGPRPVRPGDVRFGNDPSRPIAGFRDNAAAEKDPTWDVVRPAPGAQGESGALASPLRPGRTLRTPTFTLATGKVYSLVRGSAQVYAAVSQHVMIAGPLHARLVQTVKAGDTFQWVEHNLTPYKGLPAHLEFTALDGADFAIAMVVQAAQTPGKLDRPNQALARLLSGKETASLESLAAGYQKLLTDVVEGLAADRLTGAADAADSARLGNWLLAHPESFPPDAAAGASRERQRPEADAGREFLVRQEKLVGQIRRESRLALALQDGNGVDEHVFIRGSHKTPGPVVRRRFLEALAGDGPLAIARGSGRLELARQMTDPARNPFLARVLLNRVWHHLFGRGLVASVDNFGVLGERPSHPELLDFLADQFVRESWSLKKLIRTLMLTRVYQLASHGDPGADQADPQNVLLHRANLRRLEGEAIRDAMLAVSGRLNPRLFGPSVPVALNSFQDGRGKPASGPLDGDGRRSLYLAVRRNFLSSFLLAFDTPIPFSTVGRRTVSNVPAQALILLNDPMVHQLAQVWARRVLDQGGPAQERIAGMYRSAFARPPTVGEVDACLAFLERQAQLAGGKTDDLAVWTDLAHVLFNAKEFIFLG
jgi:hypothetical protein